MNSKNHFLRLLGFAFRGMFILLFALSVFTATPVSAVGGPDLIIAKSYSGGNFVPLENGRTYTITVTNQGESTTSGVVTVVDAAPPATEMTVTAISGTGWTCTLGTLTCTRSDGLDPSTSYPPITVTVNVLTGAQNPQDNNATVSGGGEAPGDASNNTSIETIPVDAKPDLVVLSYELRDIATNNLITSPDADQGFYIRAKVKNQGGAGTGGVFYTGAFLDNKPNYGGEPPTLGTITRWSDFQVSTGVGSNNKGCVFYDPAPLLDQSVNDIGPLVNWGNYTRQNLNNALDPGTTEDVDIKIEYPVVEYGEVIYDNLNIRSGLKAGTYDIYVYADPTCVVGEEVNENNNSFQISLTVTGTAACTFTPGGPQIFTDVPTTHWARDYIEAMYTCGYTGGCSSSPLMFCPENVMTRVESGVFLLRSTYGSTYTPPAAPWATFQDDFSPGPWGQPWAQGLYDAGLTAGCSISPMLFCPWNQTTRAQLAVFGMRMLIGASYLPPAGTGTVFADVSASDWFAGWAEQAYAGGIIQSCGTFGGRPMFCPENLVTRAEASFTIAKAKNLVP